MAPKKIITIVGATGNQGSSVLSTLLPNPSYSIRALTRDPTSPKAKALAAKGVTLVTADLNDLASLKAAFSGSHIIFAVTDFFEPFSKYGPEKAVEVEVQQGTNLARAASTTSTLEHYIWSTLPNSRVVSGGQYVIPHFEGKNRIDAVIRSDKELLWKTTFLWVTWFHVNYTFPIFTPYLIPTAGKYVQLADYSPDTPIETIGDTRSNIGPFVQAILEHPRRTRNGTIVKASIGNTTAGQLLKTWGKVNGKEVAFVRTDEETYNKMWPGWAEEMGGMMRFWDEFRESWVDEGEVLDREDLGIEEGRFVKLEASLKTLKL